MTLKEIADLAGVSRGTVDRVLNNRGNVKPETELHVRQILEEVQYRPNKAGRALAAIRNPVKIGVILASEGNPFFKEVLRGISAAGEELKDFGVEIVLKSTKGYDVEQQLALMQELADMGIDGLALAPINDPRIVQEINRFVGSRITVVSLNQDISGSLRACYVGSDYYKCGNIAAGLIGKLDAQARVAILTGTMKMMGHKQRVNGFQKTLRENYPQAKVVAIEENYDDEQTSYEAVQKILREHQDTTAFFFSAAGTVGGIRALQAAGKKVITVTVDTTVEILEFLQDGWIDATIGQQPYLQGYEAVKILYESLVNGEKISREFVLVKNEIFIRESI